VAGLRKVWLKNGRRKPSVHHPPPTIRPAEKKGVVNTVNNVLGLHFPHTLRRRTSALPPTIRPAEKKGVINTVNNVLGLLFPHTLRRGSLAPNQSAVLRVSSDGLHGNKKREKRSDDNYIEISSEDGGGSRGLAFPGPFLLPRSSSAGNQVSSTHPLLLPSTIFPPSHPCIQIWGVFAASFTFFSRRREETPLCRPAFVLLKGGPWTVRKEAQTQTTAISPDAARYRNAMRKRMEAIATLSEEGGDNGDGDEQVDSCMWEMRLALIVTSAALILLVMLVAATQFARISSACRGCLRAIPDCSLCSDTVMSVASGAYQCSCCLGMSPSKFSRFFDKEEGEEGSGSGSGDYGSDGGDQEEGGSSELEGAASKEGSGGGESRVGGGGNIELQQPAGTLAFPGGRVNRGYDGDEGPTGSTTTTPSWLRST
jgi:hypothetical protein